MKKLILPALLAALVVAAGAVLGLLRGNGVSDSAPIVMARETGALYVRVGDTLRLSTPTGRAWAFTPSFTSRWRAMTAAPCSG